MLRKSAILKNSSYVIPIIFIILLLNGLQAEQNSQKEEDLYKKAELVLIKGGEFIMGVDRSKKSKSGKKTYIDDYAHKVYVDSFYLDKYEVTNYQYYVYCLKTGAKLPELWGMKEFFCGLDFPNHPVIGVPHHEAKKFAEWRGMRLPTEAEWEYAARGGLVGKKYPLGDEQDKKQANFGRNYRGTMAVGSFPPNGYDLYDMSGNVVEWVADNYAKDYYLKSPYKNPKGPEVGRFRVIRGGGWFSGPYCCNVYNRNGLKQNWVDFNVGFRCVKDVK
jgi:iron(II)-dependent oxidoreductase